jgi:hypothetical protein
MGFRWGSIFKRKKEFEFAIPLGEDLKLAACGSIDRGKNCGWPNATGRYCKWLMMAI